MARRRKLSPERKEFIQGLLAHYNPKDAQDVQDMLKDLLGDTLQGMLETITGKMSRSLATTAYGIITQDDIIVPPLYSQPGK